MKTQYFNVISNKDGLLIAKGKSYAMCVNAVDPSALRNTGTGFFSMKDAQATRKAFHIGIVKVSDKAATFFE